MNLVRDDILFVQELSVSIVWDITYFSRASMSRLLKSEKSFLLLEIVNILLVTAGLPLHLGNLKYISFCLFVESIRL